MIPLKITAELFNGFAANDPFSPAIDGILAYWHCRLTMGDDEFIEAQSTGNLSTVENLQLAKTKFGDDWWYQCSLPIYKTHAEHQHHFHRRFDAFHAETRCDKQGKIETRCAPYKSTRMAVRLIVTRKVVWHVVGDKSEIESLLAHCHAIGAKTGSGYGRVKRWSVQIGGDESLARIHRALPVNYADKHGINGMQIYWGYRPAVRLPQNKTLCVIPRQ
jgi:CRISPR type IV-associated protein Csf3